MLEGWDASGKGGAIKRLVAKLDPRHVRVKQYAAPTPDELRHPWLWRFWPALPGWGGMAILDRSWYGRVLVERVEGFATEDEWRRAYDEINAFERTLADEGTVLVKLWLHLSDEEQLKRFEARQDDPLKAYKLTDEDWRNRGKRAAYCEAIEEMLERTGTEWAPWHLVEGDSKRFARVKVVETVIAAAEEGLARHGRVAPPGAYVRATTPSQTGRGMGSSRRHAYKGDSRMRRSLCALLAVPVALATAGPALAAKDKDAFNSQRPAQGRHARGHPRAPAERSSSSPTPTTASARRALRATTPRWPTSRRRLEKAGYDVSASGVPVRLLRGHRAAGVRPGLAAARGVHHAR